ncbi:hypothetical protein RI367_003858 [Sorochytrium milnesiophthora]
MSKHVVDVDDDVQALVQVAREQASPEMLHRVRGSLAQWASRRLYTHQHFYPSLARILVTGKPIGPLQVLELLWQDLGAFAARATPEEAVKWQQLWQYISGKQTERPAQWMQAITDSLVHLKDANDGRAVSLLLALTGVYSAGAATWAALQPTIVEQLAAAHTHAIVGSPDLQALLVHCVSTLIPQLPVGAVPLPLRAGLIDVVTDVLCSPGPYGMRVEYDHGAVSQGYIQTRLTSPFYNILGRTANALCVLLHCSHTLQTPGDVLLRTLNRFTQLTLAIKSDFQSSSLFDIAPNPEMQDGDQHLDQYWEIAKRNLFVVVMLGQEALSILPLMHKTTGLGRLTALLRSEEQQEKRTRSFRLLRHLIAQLRSVHFVTRKFSPPFQSYIEHIDALLMAIKHYELQPPFVQTSSINAPPSPQLAPSMYAAPEAEMPISRTVLGMLLSELTIELSRTPKAELEAATMPTTTTIVRDRLLFDYHFDLSLLLHPSIYPHLPNDFLLDYLVPLGGLMSSPPPGGGNVVKYTPGTHALIPSTLVDLCDNVHLLTMKSVEQAPSFTAAAWIWYAETLFVGFATHLHDRPSPVSALSPVSTIAAAAVDHIIFCAGFKSLCRGLSALRMHEALEWLLFTRLPAALHSHAQDPHAVDDAMTREYAVAVGVALNNVAPRYIPRLLDTFTALTVPASMASDQRKLLLQTVVQDWDKDGLEHARKETLVRWWNTHAHL